LLEEGKDEEAKAQFALALQHGRGTAIAITLERADKQLREAENDRLSQRKAKQKAAADMFEHTVTWARRDGVEKSVLAKALFGRGRAHDPLQQYVEAITDFREASGLGHTDAGSELWWTTDRRGNQVRDQGKPVEGLLITWTNLLDLTADVRKTIELRDLKSNTSFWQGIGRLHADLKSASIPPAFSDCDRLTSYPFDPLPLRRASSLMR
jgi:hypothetical protein